MNALKSVARTQRVNVKHMKLHNDVQFHLDLVVMQTN